MSETSTCRFCAKTIFRADDRWMPRQSTPFGADAMCGHAPVSVLYHQPRTEDGRPESGPYLLHLGLHLWDDEQPIPADTLGPDFLTDGDSWNQWGEPFDESQHVTVRLDAIPDDPEAHAEEAVLALRALIALRGIEGRVGDYASYTVADGDWSEWEIVVGTCHV